MRGAGDEEPPDAPRGGAAADESPPSGRSLRAVFFDVENTSRPADVAAVLEHLELTRLGLGVTLVAMGNWRVVGQETATLLARRGATLAHSAPVPGVKDWSDLRIAVAAGVWLAGARAGDVLEVISDDQAFDAVGDVAASRGVIFRRLSYRALSPATRDMGGSPSPRSRQRRRGSGRSAPRQPA